MIVTEVYVGRIPEINEIFEEFKKLRQNYSALKTWSNAKQTARIERLIEQFWGFAAFSLNIDPQSAPNAFTYPVASSIDINPGEYIETTSKGYRYSKKANVAAISTITKGLFKNADFSDEEAFAVFLHEIGHSFVHRSPMICAQQEVYKTTILISILQQIIISTLSLDVFGLGQAVGSLLSSTNTYKLIKTKFQKAIKKVPLLRESKMTLEFAIKTISNATNNIIYTIFNLTGLQYLSGKLSKSQYDTIIKKQEKITGKANAYARSSERLSDDFASMYGFGSYISSALLKMENPDNQGMFMKISHSYPIIEKIFNKSDAIVMEMDGLIGTHPSAPDRILYILEGMKKDLANDKSLPEKTKKELRDNISKTEKIVNDIKNNTGIVAKNRNEYMQALTIIGINNGSSEDFMEKRFTNRDELDKFYKDNQVADESVDYELMIELEGFINF